MCARARRTVFVLGLLLATSGFVRADGEGLDAVMYHSPELPPPTVVPVFPDTFKPAWVEALSRPEASYKLRTAQTIAEAHGRGMKGLETTVPALVRELERKDQPAAVLLAVAQTLIVLDAKDAAPQLFARLTGGNADLRELIEPALARWNYQPARAMWLERLKQSPSRRGTVLAIRGLLAMKETKAAPRLQDLALAHDGIPVVRLEAAKALAEFRQTGAEAVAKNLTADSSLRGITSRLVAAVLLRRHSGDEAIRLLQSLAKDAEPTVAAQALTRLVELDAKHVAPVLESALANADAAVRLLAVEALLHEPTAPNLTRLANRLEDEHPAVRTKSRLSLLKLAAKDDLRPAVVQQAVRVLAGSNWGGLQQAALLVAAFDHKPATDRLLALCTHDRPEVFVTAAWAIRRLAVPNTHAAVFALFQRRSADLKAASRLPGRTQQAMDEQIGQFAQQLGEAKYRAADAAFRGLIPPKTGGIETRAAAVWALGRMYEGEKGLGFEAAVLARLNAVSPFDFEEAHVRQMCAVTLGRVGYEPAVASLRKFCPTGKPAVDDPVNNSCGWALGRITGQNYPDSAVAEERFSNFFLVPLEKD